VRITDQWLKGLALRMLDDAVAEAMERVVPHSLGLRLALSFLASQGDFRREPFDAFWRAMRYRNDMMRQVRLKQALFSIQLEIGWIDVREYAALKGSLPVQTKKGWR